MVANLLVFTLGAEFLSFFRTIETTVEKAVSEPGSAAELDPANTILQVLFGLDFHYPEFLPVGSGLGASISHIFIVIGEADQIDPDRPVRR